ALELSSSSHVASDVAGEALAERVLAQAEVGQAVTMDAVAALGRGLERRAQAALDVARQALYEERVDPARLAHRVGDELLVAHVVEGAGRRALARVHAALEEARDLVAPAHADLVGIDVVAEDPAAMRDHRAERADGGGRVAVGPD